jgi:hypothetical protein
MGRCVVCCFLSHLSDVPVCRKHVRARFFAVPQHTWDWMERSTLQAVIRDVHRKCLRDARAESLWNVFSSVVHFVVVDTWG